MATENTVPLRRLRLRSFSARLPSCRPSSPRCSTRSGSVRSRASLHLEIIALRHQLAVVNRSRRPRLRVTSADRMLWAWLSRAWRGWRSAVHIVKPETVIAWHRRGFRLFWTWKSRHRIGRPTVPHDIRALIRELSTSNPLWGAPRIQRGTSEVGDLSESVDRRQVHATTSAPRNVSFVGRAVEFALASHHAARA